MRRILALAAALTLTAGVASAESHEGAVSAPPAYQLDVAFVCGTALDSQKHYANNLIAWMQARCKDGFIGDDVCKEVNHYVEAYSGQVEASAEECRARIEAEGDEE